MTEHWIGLSLISLITALLGCATYTDLKARLIPNPIPIAIAALAPVFWINSGLAPWPGFGLMILQALACLAVFGFIFTRGLMGGGDVKLISALALWLPSIALIEFLLRMSILGGFLALIQVITARLRPRSEPIEVPYGVAIAAAALLSLGAIYGRGEPYLKAF